jgi:hypothetical protein
VTWRAPKFDCGQLLSSTFVGGGIQAAGSLKLLKVGENIIIAGLFVQVLFFGLFLVVAINFDLRYRRVNKSLNSSGIKPLATAMLALHATSALIMVRSIFRVVEYIMGNNGFLLRHEYFLYIFDAALMIMVMIVFIVVHPSGSLEKMSNPATEVEKSTGTKRTAGRSVAGQRW